MQTKQKECGRLIKTARQYVDDARRYLESGEAINWVGDKISSGIMWAIEAWMIENKFNPYSDWMTMRFQFIEKAPKPLSSRVSYCLSELALIADPPPDIEGGISMLKVPEYGSEEWKEAIKKCISQADDNNTEHRRNYNKIGSGRDSKPLF